jgi:pimeloyl-ACP methyl ester carboxylesterase
MATYVLVPGGWLGGWCWQPIARALRQRGHDVYPVTLTGLGERVHLATPEVDLEAHITDVVNLLEYEDLHDVLLLGHSYGAAPITGAADRVPERIARLLYLDSAPLPDGVALADTYAPEARRFAERQVAELGDGWRWPLPSWEDQASILGVSAAGLDEEARKRIRARSVPQPFRSFTQPLRLRHPDGPQLPKLAILTSFPLAQVQAAIASSHPLGRAMAGPEWQFVELSTGHWPMFSIPDQLADLLDDLPPVEPH